MRSLYTLAATAATLVPLISAVPESNTVQFDFHKRKIDARTSPSRLARRQTVNAGISNEIIGYFINVTVGTPGQPLTLQLDTGSSDIWFDSSTARFCTEDGGQNCQLGTYDASQSSTTEDASDLGQFQIRYVDGTEIAGDYIRDTLTIGNTSLTNLTMAAATDTELGYGIMGIGFPADESITANGLSNRAQPYPNVIDVLVAENKINTRAYSLWLDDLESNTGSILFGGVDSDKFTGDLIAIPIQRDSQSLEYTSFSVAWTGLTIKGSQQNSDMSPTTPQSVILDSGTTDLYLPDDIANNILSGVGAESDPDAGAVVPCGLAKNDLVFTFTFGGSNGPQIQVPLAEFVVPLLTTTGQTPVFSSGQYKGQDVCSFGILPAGNDPVLFGDTFMRSAYIVYDLDNLQIALAQTNTNGDSNSGNVKAFSGTSDPIPDATTTVAGVTVSQTFTGNPNHITETALASSIFEGDGSSARGPTFALVSATSSSRSGSGSGSGSSSSAAGPMTIPSIERSTLAVMGVTFAAFCFGVMLV